jgi:transcriptional regulator with XRE-family HTH domain
MGEAERALRLVVPLAVRDTRRALRWTQTELGASIAVSQSQISRFERGRPHAMSLAEVGAALDVLGIRLLFSLEPPHAIPLQRDAAHARCLAYATRRLRAADWHVRHEVAVREGTRFGWIDILAWNGGTRSLVVIEIKTELRDVGAIQRTLGWYEKQAIGAAHSIGWRPAMVASVLLVLATAANDSTAMENSAIFGQAFPTRATELLRWFRASPRLAIDPGIALLDPRSHRAGWLIPLSIDGRRAALRYANYVDFMAAIRSERRTLPKRLTSE